MFFKKSLALTMMITASAGAAQETPFDGIFAPAGSFEAWSCDPGHIGGDGGAVAVAGGYLQGVENECELTNPTPVRDMNAVLYDAKCSGEGEQYTQRLMLMQHDSGVYVIQDGYAAEWRFCD